MQRHHYIWPWVKSRSLLFWRSLSHKSDELGYTLLLNTNRKACMESQIATPDLTLIDCGNVKVTTLWRLVSCVGVELEHVFLLNTSRKSHMGNPIASLDLSLLTLKAEGYLLFRCLMVLDLYVIHVVIGNVLIWISVKVMYVHAAFALPQRTSFILLFGSHRFFFYNIHCSLPLNRYWI